jgi:hypothetical protein
VIGGGKPLAKWNACDLEQRLCRALDVAKQCISRFGTHGYTNTNEPGIAVRPEKLIGETAILLLAASAARCGAEVGARVDAVASLLIPHARSRRILMGICLEPSLALDYAEAHICLTRLGYRDPAVDNLLRQSLDSQAGSGRERVPHRMLEQHWLNGIWTGADLGPRDRSSSSLPVLSILNRPLDVLGVGHDEMYAFTHALMYVRDFNIKPRSLPRARRLILAEAEAALARCLDEENYDLGGEVLMAWPLTGGPWSPGAAFGFRVLADIEDKNGMLPSPSTRQDRLNKLEGDARTNYLLATAYHTVYVMGLLCAATLHPGRAPPAKLATRSAWDGSANAADTILRFLDSDGRSPYWRQVVDRISLAERDALARLLLNIALHRKVSRREFGVVHELLTVGHALGVADTPSASQAAEMLERLAAYHHMAMSEQATGQQVKEAVASANTIPTLPDLRPGSSSK